MFSPAFWTDDDRLYDLVERTPAPPARIAIEVGDREDGDERIRREFVDGFERMTALLRRKGYAKDSLLAVLHEGGVHHESQWAGRLPDVFRFLLG